MGASYHTPFNVIPSSMSFSFGRGAEDPPRCRWPLHFTDAPHHDPPLAKAACAQFAVEQDILDHIKAFNDDLFKHKISSLSSIKCFLLKNLHATLSGPRPLPVPGDPFHVNLTFKHFFNTLISEAKGRTPTEVVILGWDLFAQVSAHP